MRSTLVLEMLNDGKIEDLKAALQDEIYQESLKKKPGAKNRYSAMKRYLKTISESRPILTKPCAVEFEGKQYSSFTNSYSIALTTESCGELEMCDEPDRYPKITQLIKFDGDEGVIDFNKVLAEAKSKGYKYTKTGIYKNDYLMHYNGAYFRMALVDITYGIIDDGSAVEVYSVDTNRPLTIQNDIGVAMIMPVRMEDLTDSIIIEA